MDRAEAIKWYENEIRLLEAAPNLNGINGSCMEEEWKKQAEIHKLALAALREQEQSQWVSVNERLPEMKADVLVYFQNEKNMAVGFICDVDEDKKMWCAYTDDGFYTDCDFEPSHWMPLPEPPKEGAE